MRNNKKLKIDNNLPPPFAISEVTQIIKNLKNTQSTGPDNISNIHLKHLGPVAIKALTEIYNRSWLYNEIPQIWKHANIIPILKPNKQPNLPSSYRPISLLSNLAKVMERLIQPQIKQQLPVSPIQHGFKENHSTSTLLTNLTQHIADGFNQTSPPSRTILAAIDINKAFDTLPKHILIQKIHNTTLHNNHKRWLVNLLTGRSANVIHKNTKSHTKILYNGLAQGAILSPPFFNLFTHDIPLPDNTKTQISLYADDMTITAQDPKILIATNLLQNYLSTIQDWLLTNRMTASPDKSSITLFTPDRRESNLHPRLTMFGTPLPLNKNPILLGITYDTHLTFTPHTKTIKHTSLQKNKVLKTLSGTTFGQSKESQCIIYKQYYRNTIDYAHTAWWPIASNSKTNIKNLEIAQNAALRTITGCLHTTPVQHLLSETKTVPIETHLNELGIKFYNRALDPSHPCHHITQPSNTPRNKKPSPASYYSHLYNTIPPPPINMGMNKHIHTIFTGRYLSNRDNNTILNMPSPNTHPSEMQLCRRTRVLLSQLRCGHSHILQSYKHKINLAPSPICPRCGNGPKDVQHLLLDCEPLTPHRTLHSITSIADLWARPGRVASFLGSAGIL